MLLRDRLFSLAFLSFLIFSPLSSVIEISDNNNEVYSYAEELLGDMGPEELRIKSIDAPPPWTCADATGTKFSFPNLATSKCAPRSITWDVGFGFPSEDLTGTTFQVLFQWKYLETADFALVNATWDSGSNQYRASATFTYLPGTADNSLCSYDLVARMRINGSNCFNADAVIVESAVIWDDISNTNVGTHDINHDPSSAGVEDGTPAETVELCRGDNNPVRLMDASTFNCTAAFEPEPTNENRKSRWVQWVYGTFSDITTGAGATEKIIINGVSYTNADLPIYGTPFLDQSPPDVIAPSAFTDDIRMPTSALVGERFEVTIRSFNVCNPFSRNNDLSPPQGGAGNVFEINGVGGVLGTEQAGLNAITGGVTYYANDNPITRTYDLLIAPQPPIPTALDKDYCYNTDLTAASNPGFEFSTGSTIQATEWYEDNAGVVDFGSPIANSNGGTSTELEAADYTGVGGPGITGTDVGTYYVWGRYSANTGSQNCWSEPVRIQMDVREALTQPGIITSSASFPICADAPNFTFSVPNPTSSGTPGGAWEYQWSFVAGLDGNLNIVGSSTGQTITVDITNNAASGARRVQVRKRYTNTDDNGNRCFSTFRTFDFTIDPVSVGGTLAQTNAAICLGSPTGNITLSGNTGGILDWEVSTDGGTNWNSAGLGTGNPINPTPATTGTYEYRAVVQSGVCAVTRSSSVAITVNPIPAQPNITSTGSTICEDASVTLTANGSTNANSYRWYKDGVFTGDTGNAITLSNDADDGVYTVEGVGIAPTNCVGALSAGETVRIEPLPTAGNPTGGGAVCGGNPAPDIVWPITGRPPFNISYTVLRNAVLIATVNVNNYTPPEAFPGPYTFTISNPNPPTDHGQPVVNGDVYDYQFISLNDDVVATDPSCSATALGGVASINIGGVPPSFDSGPTLSTDTECDAGGATTDPDLLFSLDPGNINGIGFTLTYTVDGSANRTKNFNTDAAGDPTAAVTFSDGELNNVGNHTINIVSILSPSGCLSTFNTPLAFEVRALPNITTQPADTEVCDGTDITTISVVVAAGVPNLSYQWQEDIGGGFANVANGGVYSGATSSTLTLTNAPLAMDGYDYRVIVTGYNAPSTPPTCPTTSGTATLTVHDYAIVSAQPVDAEVCEASTVNYSVTATGTGLAYRWQQDPDGAGGLPFADLTDGTVAGVTYAGTGTATLSMSGLTLALDGSDYRVKLTTTGPCENFSNQANLIVNPLPVANDITPELCEDLPRNSDQVVGVDLTIATYSDAITGIIGSAGRSIEYYTLPSRLPANAVPDPTNVTINNGTIIYTRVIDTATSGVTSCLTDATMTFTVYTLPEAIDQDNVNNAAETVFCEDFPVGSGITTGIDLTVLENDITNNQANRSVTWYDDPAYTVLVPDPTDASANNGKVFYPRVTETASGQGCIDDAEVTITVNTRPANNPILGASDQCVGGATSLYQITPGPAGTTYNWNIPTDFTVFGGGTAADFFVLLQFPVVTTQTLEVTEVSPENCDGNVQQLVINVQASPPISSITGPAAVCDGEAGVVYSVTNTPNTSYAWTVPVGASIILGQGTNAITVNFGNTGGNIDVVPTSSGGCSGGNATLGVTVNPLPILDPALDNTVCSDDDINITLAAAGTSPVPAASFDITASVSPGLVANTGPTTGNGLTSAAIFNDNYTNTTGGALTVTYTVTPISGDNCKGATVNVIATIDPEPVMASGLDLTACSDVATGLNLNTAAGSVVAANYNIISENVPGGLTPGGSNVTVPQASVAFDYLSNQTFNNVGNTPIVVTYVVEPVSALNCVGNQLTINVTINPEPVINAGLNTTVCSDEVIGVTLTNDGVSVAAAFYNLVNVAVPGGLTPGGGNAAFPILNVPANYIAADVYTNKTTLPIDVVYEVKGISADNCFGDSRFITVTINPEPIMSNLLANTVCSDAPASITLASLGTAVAAATYNLVDVTIPVGATAGGGNAVFPANNQAANYIFNDSYTNQTGAAIDVIYEVRGVSGNNCIGDSEFITLTIDPEPVIDPALDKTVCSDDAIGLNFNTNGVSVPAVSYDFLSINIDPALTADAGNVILANGVLASYVAGDKYTNTTNASLDVVYEVRGTAAVTGCKGDSEFITVTINPEPVISPALSTTVCSDQAIGVNLATNGTSIPAANYNIVSVGIPFGITAGGGNAAWPANNIVSGYIASDTYTNQTASPLIVTYDVAGVSGANCTGDITTISVTINPEPVVDPGLDRTECSDVAIGLTLNTNGSSVAAANYNIVGVSIPPGLTAGANAVIPANSVVAAYLAGDTYTNQTNGPLVVTYEVKGVSSLSCIGDSEFIDVTINPEPVIDNTLGSTVCSDDIINLTLATDATSVPAVNYNVTGRNVSAGLVVGGSNAVIPGNGVALNYLTNDTYSNPTNNPLSVSYDVQGVSANGCIGDIQTITMIINPEPVINPTLDKTVCSDLAINLTLSTNGSSVVAANYNIKGVTIPVGVTAAAGNAVFPASGVPSGYLFNDAYTNITGAPVDVTYEVTGVSAEPCEGDSEFIVITINPEPVVDPGLNTTVCSDEVVGVVMNTNGTSVAAANYNLINVIPDVSLTPGGTNVAFPINGVAANYFANDTYENTTGAALTVTYDVQGVSAGGCLGDVLSIVVTIDPEPIVNTALDATICSDDVTNLNLSIEAGSTAAINYNIVDITIPVNLTPGGSNAVFPANNQAANYLASDTYTNTTNGNLTVVYEVRAVSALNCVGNSEFINIIVQPEPVINAGLGSTICSDAVTGVTLANDGISVAAATYNVKTVTIPPGLTAGGGNAAIPGNGVPDNYIFNDTYTNQTGAAINVTYEVTGTSAASCEGDSEFIVITIDPEPVIDPGLDVTICSDNITNINLATNGTSVVAANYNLVDVVVPPGLVPAGTNAGFPQNSVAANYIVNDSYTNQTTGQLTAVYEVRGVSAAGCLGDSEFINVIVNPEPVVSNTLNTTVCSDVAIGVNFTTDPSGVGALNYNLVNVTIPPGLTPAGTNAPFAANNVPATYIAADMYTNITAGAINVTYDVQGVSAANCVGDIRSIIVTINPEPVMNTGLDATVCSDLPIGLNFATDGISVAAASYNLVAVLPGAGLVAAGGNVVPANGINANYTSGDIYANLTNAPIDVTYEVRGVSADGCVGDSEIITITINPEPTMDAGLDNTICSDNVINLTLSDDGLGVAATAYNIVNVTIPGGLTPAGTNAAFPANNRPANYLTADSYNNVTAAPIDVTYEVQAVSGAGCIGDNRLIVMTIDPEPVINTGLNTTVCSDDVVGLVFSTNGTSVVASDYDLISVTVPLGLTPAATNVVPAANVGAGYVAGDIFTNQTGGAINVTYVVRGNSAAGCVGDNQSIIVTINPEPVINNGLDDVICSDASLGLVLNTNGISIGASNYNILGVVIDPLLSANAGNAAIPANGVAAAYLSSDSYVNATNTSLDVVYEVRGVSFSACEGDSKFITMTIEPGPVVEPTIGTTVCSEVPIGVTLATAAGSVAATAYNIIGITPNPSLVPGGANVPIANGQPANYIFNDTYTNTTSIALNVVYEIVGVSAAGCRGPSELITVIIDPEPVIDPGLDKTVCSDEAVGLILNTNGVSVGATTYNVLSVTILGGVTADAGNAAIPANGVVDGYLSNDKYTNTTGGPLTVIYEARGESVSTCEGQSRFINITIDPEPVIDPGLNTNVCSDNPVGVTLVTNGVSVAAANYNIIAVTVPGALAASGSNVAIPANGVAPGYFTADTYTNKTGGALNVIYEVKGVSAAGCIGDSEFITIAIDPEPVIDPALTNTVCSDEIIAINLNTDGTSVGASTYDVLNVTIPAGLTAAGTNAAIPGNGVGVGYISTDTYTNQTASPLTVTYEVRGTSIANCTGDSEFLDIIINPEPVINPALNAIVCSDEAAGIVFSTNGTSAPAANYNLISVTPQAGLIADAANALPGLGVLSTHIQNDRFTNTGNIDLTVQYLVEPVSPQTCVGDQLIIILTVHPEPVLDPALSPAAVCSDVPSGITLGVAAGSIAASFYNIVNISWDPTLIPAGTNASIGNNQAANAIAGDMFTNTTNVQKLVTYDIIPVSADNCQGDVQQVVFTINPAPALSPTLDKITCSDQVSGIVLSTDGISTPAQDYEVVSVAAPGLVPGVGNVALPVTTNNTMIINGDTYTNATNATLTAVYTVVPISAATCRGPARTITLTVEPTITAVANNVSPTICSNSSTDITLTSPSVPSAGNIVFNLTAVASSPNISGYIPVLSFLPQGYNIADFLVNSGNTAETVTYTITPVASGGASGSGCTGNPVVEVVTVNPQPIITPGQFDMVCSNTVTNYTITTLNGLAGTTFTWPAPTLSDPGLSGGSARGTGSSAPITDTFINNTNIRQSATYTITPTGPAPASCLGNSVQLIIYVDPQPDGTIGVDQPVVCMNGSALLNFTMTVGVAPFEIVFSDGTTDFTVSNIANTHFIAINNLTTTTTYTLKSVLDVNGCLRNLVGQSVTVTVENPVADFTPDITSDCTPLDVIFTNNNVQAGTQYTWNWGDGSPEEITSNATVPHTFVNNSTVSDISYNVMLTAQRTNGAVVCTQTQTEFVTIKAGVNLSVSTTTTEGCSPVLVTFTNNSQGVLTNKWFWREKGTTDENDIKNTFFASFVLENLSATSKTYEIVYQGDRNGCSDEVITEVLVHPDLSADFTVSPGNIISINNPVITVTNNTVNKNSWDHLWEWGDGQTTTAVDPGSHTYGTFGQFELKLTVTDPGGNCSSEQIETITVEPVLPVVDFTVDITEGCRALTVNFTNLSTSVDPSTYMWEFKDERGRLLGTSNLENPSFTFYDAGRINVTLSGSNPLGITDTETKLELIEVYEIPTASFTVTPATVYLPDQLLFTSNLSALADAFEWDFNGDGDIDSDEFEPQFKYESAGVYDVSLIATNTATTCSDTFEITKAVKVVEAGTADIPNGFFPGSGDGSGGNPGGPGGSGPPNSVFLPRIKGVREDGFNMQVFDRWGHLLFESVDQKVGWTGRDSRGKLYPVGVYVYKLELVFVSGQQTTITGDVTLIR